MKDIYTYMAFEKMQVTKYNFLLIFLIIVCRQPFSLGLIGKSFATDNWQIEYEIKTAKWNKRRKLRFIKRETESTDEYNKKFKAQLI